jgi:hypothetical protein
MKLFLDRNPVVVVETQLFQWEKTKLKGKLK